MLASVIWGACGSDAYGRIGFGTDERIAVDLPALTLTRDEILFEVKQFVGILPDEPRPLIPPRHWIPRFTMVGRALLVLAAALYVYGFSQLPRPADAIPAPSRSTSVRLAASLIVILVLLLNVGHTTPSASGLTDFLMADDGFCVR